MKSAVLWIGLLGAAACGDKDKAAPPPEPKVLTAFDHHDALKVAMSGVAGTELTAENASREAVDVPTLSALERARAIGILGSTALQQGGAFASLTGTGDISSGFDDNIYGGLLGGEAGEMNGGFGYGRSGFGPGGGGTGWGTIGTGKYGTIGKGSGGSGYGVGGGRGGMRGRTSCVPTMSIGQPSATGDLDKAIIRRYIKRNAQKLQYCYEKQLLAKASLAGAVATKFTITANGNVTGATASGVDPDVSSCIATVIKGIEFPKPKDGNDVQVSYPFIFRPAGDCTTQP